MVDKERVGPSASLDRICDIRGKDVQVAVAVAIAHSHSHVIALWVVAFVQDVGLDRHVYKGLRIRVVQEEIVVVEVDGAEQVLIAVIVDVDKDGRPGPHLGIGKQEAHGLCHVGEMEIAIVVI